MTGDRPAAALLDLDGTVLSGETVLDGAAEGVERLRAAGLPVVFLTNRATAAPAAHAAALRAGGIAADAGDVLTSAGITAAALSPADGPALVLGDEPLHDALADAGVERTADPGAAETVVASVDSDLSFDRLTAATRAIAAGARFVATNPDGARPAPDGPVPEAGAVVAALTAATGREPTVLGKPNPAAARAAADRAGVDPADCILVGDNPTTDIELGARVGAATVLLGEGVGSAEGGAEPEFRLDSLADIGAVLSALSGD